MSEPNPNAEPSPDLLAVSIGNTATAYAAVRAGEVEARRSTPNPPRGTPPDALTQQLEAACAEHGLETVVIASVNEAVAGPLAASVRALTSSAIYRIGVDVPIPLSHTLDHDAMPGQDRLLNAVAAHAVLQQACVVVDAGTCVTVDFVDGEGTFHGGAISPGAAMMLRAMHTGTDALPEVELAHPGGEVARVPFGKNTPQSMLIGVIESVRGLVRLLTERYAIAYDAYPPVIATGGDAELIFREDELVDRIVPDLTLRGIAECCRQALDS